MSSLPQSATDLLGLDSAPVASGHFVLWPREGRLTLHGRDVHLSGREFDVLRVLVLAVGHVLARKRLHEVVWGGPLPDPDTRAVDVTICQLRRRLSDASPDWIYVHTHFGCGYRFEPVHAPEDPRREAT
jgi:DNA-binding response OmpR family regulator